MSQGATWIINSIRALDSLSTLFTNERGLLHYEKEFSSNSKEPKQTIKIHEGQKNCKLNTEEYNCSLGIEYFKNKAQNIRPVEFRSDSSKKFYAMDFLYKSNLNKNPIVNCCSLCFTTCRLLTLINILKCAEIQVEYPIKNKSEKFTLFGVKTYFNKEKVCTVQNLLCVKYMDHVAAVVLVGKEVKLLPVIFHEKIDISGTSNYYKIDCSFGTEFIEQPNIGTEIGICLLRLSSVKMNRGKDETFTTQYFSEIKKAFSTSYPPGSTILLTQKILKINKNKEEKNVAEEEKDQTEVYALFAKLNTSVLDSPVAMAVILCVLGMLFLISREYSSKKKNTSKEVPIL